MEKFHILIFFKYIFNEKIRRWVINRNILWSKLPFGHIVQFLLRLCFWSYCIWLHNNFFFFHIIHNCVLWHSGGHCEHTCVRCEKYAFYLKGFTLGRLGCVIWYFFRILWRKVHSNTKTDINQLEWMKDLK